MPTIRNFGPYNPSEAFRHPLLGVFMSSETDKVSSQKLVAVTHQDMEHAREMMKINASEQLDSHPEWGATRENDELPPSNLEIIGADGSSKLKYEISDVAKDEKGVPRKIPPEPPLPDATANPVEGQENSPMSEDDDDQVSLSHDKPPTPFSPTSYNHPFNKPYQFSGPAPSPVPSEPPTPLSPPPVPADNGVRYGLFIWTRAYASRGLELRTVHYDLGSAEADRTACTISYIEGLKAKDRPVQTAELSDASVEFRDSEGNLTAQIVIKEGTVIPGSGFIATDDEEPQKRTAQTYTALNMERNKNKSTIAPRSTPIATKKTSKPRQRTPVPARTPATIKSTPGARQQTPAPARPIADDEFCICQGADDGREMIGCENDHCPHNGWFHLECLGLTVAPPEEKWYCDDCRAVKKGMKKTPVTKTPARSVASGRVTKAKAKKSGGRKR
ncbi:hypothetical protein P280DRAFT_470569 [Massarina eburnea CBS 473.64]|uniref:PHD-type domain-containing protein n=1 Tax=Massarina eburnea CBS 473.64 TaxID=1395130 RepID=A0A6A6RYZ8_9PLEO|nr:hypothetical protein P280DRAFT_470569 [Massarina eburnea CBS 473.64]